MAISAHSFTMRAAAVATIGALALFGLAGCKAETDTQSSSTTHSPRATSTSSASATPDAVASQDPAAKPTHAPGTPVGVACDGLISLQQMYDFNPNYSRLSNYTPKAGTDGSVALEFQGLACQWVNDTSGNLISVSVARPAAADLAALRSSASHGTAVSGLGDAAYFGKKGQVGQLQVFDGPFWLSTSSAFYGTPDDASQLLSMAMSSLK
jgi:hypothetical protein